MTEREHIGKAALILGDCREHCPNIPVDLLLTDPPYGIGADRMHMGNDRSAIGHAERKAWRALQWDDAPAESGLLRDLIGIARNAIVWGGNYFDLGPSIAPLVWDKGHGPGLTFADCEIAWTNLPGVCRRLTLLPRVARELDQARYHPTQKPVRLMAWCLTLAPTAQCVLDPFMGSGSTGVACVHAGRAFIGIERERRFFDAACERISRAHAQGALFEPRSIEPAAEQMGLDL